MRNKNARVIIPLAVLFWVLAIVVFREGTPGFVFALFVIAFVITIPAAVFYLIADMGWTPLARRYRALAPFRGDWRLSPTVHMSRVSVRDPAYARNMMRFLSTLRTGVSEEGLHLTTLLSRVPLLSRLFPELLVPWSAITKATTFEAPGWVKPVSEPGAIVNIGYDPNFTGTFVELEVGQPPVFIQLPLPSLGEFGARLGLPDSTTAQTFQE
jgi:hypothetical protein